MRGAAAAAAEMGVAQQFGRWTKDWCAKKKGQNCPFQKRTVKLREKIRANLPLFMRRTTKEANLLAGIKKGFLLYGIF